MKVLDVIQGGEPWANERRGLLTASRMHQLIRPKTMKISAEAKSLAYELLAEQLVPPHYWIGEEFQTAAMAHGTAAIADGTASSATSVTSSTLTITMAEPRNAVRSRETLRPYGAM